MPRARLFPAAFLCALPLIGCGDGDKEAIPEDPEEAQIVAEQEDVAEAQEEMRDAEDDLEDANENVAEQRQELKEAIAGREEAEDSIDDARRQVAKEKADLVAEKKDEEPDFEQELLVPGDEEPAPK